MHRNQTSANALARSVTHYSISHRLTSSFGEDEAHVVPKEMPVVLGKIAHEIADQFARKLPEVYTRKRIVISGGEEKEANGGLGSAHERFWKRDHVHYNNTVIAHNVTLRMCVDEIEFDSSSGSR